MPHTSRRKRATPTIPVQKRLQVTDDEGWTHVTSGGNVRRVKRTTARAAARGVNNKAYDNGDGEETTDDAPVLMPAEAPSRLTLAELQEQFEAHRRTWESSDTWRTLVELLAETRRDLCSKTVLDSGVQDSGLSSSPPASSASAGLDAIVCIGLGSPSGFLGGGWVDRRTTSLYQLAALVSIRDQLYHKSNSLPVYAQDPVFNTLDHALLESLGIKVLEHPAAFERITTHTAVFCPGAEWKHLLRLLSSNPRLVLSTPNNDDPRFQPYLDRITARRLPVFTPYEHAFWGMTLYRLHDVS